LHGTERVLLKREEIYANEYENLEQLQSNSVIHRRRRQCF